MGLVDQRRVRRLRALDERTRGVGSRGVECNGDDLEPLRVELLTQRLPPGQVETAPSPGRPRDQEHLLAAQAGQPELVAVEVG